MLQQPNGATASEPERDADLGEFHLKRDEYFVYLTWPTGHHGP